MAKAGKNNAAIAAARKQWVQESRAIAARAKAITREAQKRAKAAAKAASRAAAQKARAAHKEAALAAKEATRAARSLARSEAKFSATQAALARRAATAHAKEVKLEWYIKQVSTTIRLSLKQRVKIATHLVKTKVVQNISRPVTKRRYKSGSRTLTMVSNRSRPGEFPKADTTQLMKSIFEDYRSPSPGVFDGYIGTPIDYGVILELYRDRSFLKRTLREQSPRVTAILSGPLK